MNKPTLITLGALGVVDRVLLSDYRDPFTLCFACLPGSWRIRGYRAGSGSAPLSRITLHRHGKRSLSRWIRIRDLAPASGVLALYTGGYAPLALPRPDDLPAAAPYRLAHNSMLLQTAGRCTPVWVQIDGEGQVAGIRIDLVPVPDASQAAALAVQIAVAAPERCG